MVQPSETGEMYGDPKSEIKNTSGDSDFRKMENLLNPKFLEIVDRLQLFVGYLNRVLELYKKKTEDFNKERDDLLKSLRQMFKDHEEQMKQWFEQNKNVEPKSDYTDCEYFDCGSLAVPHPNQLPIVRSESEESYFIDSAADLLLDSEDVGIVDESDTEDELFWSDEAVEEEEDLEAIGYTPTTSAMDLPSFPDRTEDGKRKASDMPDDDNAKRRRLTLVECPVCKEALPEMTKCGKLLMVATCGHVLCSNCAMRIFTQQRKKCPICNTRFDIKKLLPVYL